MSARPKAPKRQWIRYVVGLALAIGLVAFGLPALTGVPWRSIRDAVDAIPNGRVFGLVVLWIAGLLVNAIALGASLPLSTSAVHPPLWKRWWYGLTMSLTGSAVANVLPVGGAAGIAVNYRMMRTWGYGRTDVATYTVVSNLWDVLGKLVLAAVVLGTVALGGSGNLGPLVHSAALVVALIAGGVVVIAISTLASDKLGGSLARWIEGRVTAVFVAFGSPRRPRIAEPFRQVQIQTRQVVRHGIVGLNLGTFGYIALLAALLYACLYVTGVKVPLMAMLVALTADRLLTMAGITPSGFGMVELGMAAVLLAAGGDPLSVATGTLVYRALTVALEIPVGGAWLGLWEWRHHVALKRAGVTPGHDPVPVDAAPAEGAS